ncbi:MAG: Hsp20/alpha crystallin family protein [Victivallales bacterium]|jgi:HSP20 family protein
MKNLPAFKKGHATLARTIEHPFALLHGMNELFEGIVKDFVKIRLPAMERVWQEPVFVSPKIDISETDEAYNVRAELPGLEEKDIVLTIDHDALVIKGDRKQERELKRRNYLFPERNTGHYYGELPMPWGVDSEKVKATFKKGILKVTLPKIEKERMERRRIKITSE